MMNRKALAAMLLAPCLLLGLAGEAAHAAGVSKFKAKESSQLSIKKYGTEKDSGQALMVLVGSGSSGPFAYTDHDGYVYDGKFKKLSKGKYIQFTLTAKGKNTLKKMLKQWIVEAAQDDGKKAVINSLTIKKLQIGKASMKNGMPNQVTVKAQGEVKGKLDGKSTKAQFTYQCKIKFVKKLK